MAADLSAQAALITGSVLVADGGWRTVMTARP
jgi:hypothetical protein